MSKAAVSRKSRRSLLLLLLVFIVPILLAKMALDNQWFNYGVTNQGELLDEPLTLSDVDIEAFTEKQWLLLYTVPQNCDQRCIETLKGIENTYFALGKETPRVTPIALSHSPFNAEQLKQLNQKHWRIQSTPEKALQRLTEQTVYVADPLGNIILQYNTPEKTQELTTFGKAMLTDLKKLLKYSRIG